ncbi:hypothetical protein T01_10907 [Trichinella spiralis]|uniref:Uncharacterized protein n=1 Tax=Trichinella spiralis TaxID=6334 RepID=A0A0V1AS96_TRISP|nr:hypothetical protein T01_10907 [Trichinella spiralis]
MSPVMFHLIAFEFMDPGVLHSLPKVIKTRIRNSCPMQLTCNLHFYIAHLQHYFNVVTLERHIPDHERYSSQTTMNKS